MKNRKKFCLKKILHRKNFTPKAILSCRLIPEIFTDYSDNFKLWIPNFESKIRL